MKNRSALGLAMTGGLEAVMMPWAGVAPLIEVMRKTEVTDMADKVLPLKRFSKGLTSGQMPECFVPLTTLASAPPMDHGKVLPDDNHQNGQRCEGTQQGRIKGESRTVKDEAFVCYH